MDQIDEFAASLLIVRQAARLLRMAGHKKTGGLESLPVFLCFFVFVYSRTNVSISVSWTIPISRAYSDSMIW